MDYYGGRGKSEWTMFIKNNYHIIANDIGSKEPKDVMKKLSEKYRLTHPNAGKSTKHGICYRLPEEDCLKKPICRYVKPTKINIKTGKVKRQYCMTTTILKRVPSWHQRGL